MLTRNSVLENRSRGDQLQTAPLLEHSLAFHEHASPALFRLVADRVGVGQARGHKGRSAFSPHRATPPQKIMICEVGEGKINELDPELADGIDILVRLQARLERYRHHDERFAYVGVAREWTVGNG